MLYDEWSVRKRRDAAALKLRVEQAMDEEGPESVVADNGRLVAAGDERRFKYDMDDEEWHGG